jgi:hypothetical protein
MGVSVTRYFIGDDTADVIGLPPADWTRHVVSGIREVTRTISVAAAENWLLRASIHRLSKLTLRGFVDHEREGGRPKFVIPDRLTPMKRTPIRPIQQIKLVSQRVRRTVPATRA